MTRAGFSSVRSDCGFIAAAGRWGFRLLYFGLIATLLLLGYMVSLNPFILKYVADEFPLFNGYELVSLSSDNWCLCAKGRDTVIVGPAIDGYRVIGTLILGHVFKGSIDTQSQEGYFIFDTRTGRTELALDKENWTKGIEYSGRSAPSYLLKPQDNLLRFWKVGLYMLGCVAAAICALIDLLLGVRSILLSRHKEV